MKHGLKERLKAGETVAICNPDFPTPRLIEFIGTLGFDTVFIDCEHASTDFAAVEELARAARSCSMASVVRPWSNEPGLINRYLSCGVDGIQTPHVDSVAEAKAIIEGISQWEGDHKEKLLLVMIEFRKGTLQPAANARCDRCRRVLYRRCGPRPVYGPKGSARASSRS